MNVDYPSTDIRSDSNIKDIINTDNVYMRMTIAAFFAGAVLGTAITAIYTSEKKVEDQPKASSIISPEQVTPAP